MLQEHCCEGVSYSPCWNWQVRQNYQRLAFLSPRERYESFAVFVRSLLLQRLPQQLLQQQQLLLALQILARIA